MKNIFFTYSISENLTDSDLESRLHLVSKMKERTISQNIFEIFFPLSKSKVVYLRPFSSSLPFRKFRKQNFMHFGHQHVETGPNCSHELASFLKYHMPLRPCGKVYHYQLYTTALLIK